VDRCNAPGTASRHIAADGEFTSHLAINRAAALAHAGIDAQSIDLIVRAFGVDAGQHLSATAVAVQDGLGIIMARRSTCRRCAPASCSRLATADNFLRAGSTSARW